MSSFRDPLLLVKKYDSCEEWKSFYDESSPNFKPRISSPEKSACSSGRKSVTIVEDNNEVRFIDKVTRFDDEWFPEKENVCPLNHSPSWISDLSEMAEINLSSFSMAPLSIFEDDIQPAAKLGQSRKQRDSQSPSENVMSAVNSASIPDKTFADNAVPDFPFQDPSEIVEDPESIKSTGMYFFERGDDSCFLLDERLYTIKEGISAYLSDSIENNAVSKSIMNVIEGALNSVFNK